MQTTIGEQSNEHNVNIYKRQTPEQLFNWSEQCLTCRHFEETSPKQMS